MLRQERENLEFRLRGIDGTISLLRRAMGVGGSVSAARQIKKMILLRDRLLRELNEHVDCHGTGSLAVDDAMWSLRERNENPIEPRSDWVSEAFKDQGYRIEREGMEEVGGGGGDCLYRALGRALGMTVRALKMLVAREATTEEFVVKKNMYEDAKREYPVLLNRLQETPRNTRSYVVIYDMVQRAAADKQSYAWLEHVDDLESFRTALINDGRAWGDAETLGKLQVATGVKALMVSKKATKDKGGKPVLYECSVVAPSDWRPRLWVMLAYDEDGSHFELISYARRLLFRCVEEIPYSMRRLMRS